MNFRQLIVEGPANKVEMIRTDVLRMFREYDRSNLTFSKHSPETYQKLKKDILKKGIKVPLTITYDLHREWALVTEGNHRIQIAIDTGIKKLPATVWFRGDLERGAGVRGYQKEFGHPPEWVKPSEIGIVNNVAQVKKFYTKPKASPRPKVTKKLLEPKKPPTMKQRRQKFAKLVKIQPKSKNKEDILSQIIKSFEI